MKIILVVPVFLMLCYIGGAQQLNYLVEFPNAAHHEARITMDVRSATTAPLVFRMSRSSPGRYATHEFGKNVYDVTASDAGKRVLTVKKLDADVYQVANHKGKVSLTYTLYANHPDGTYAGIDPSSIQLNMPAAFMWVKGMEKVPISIRFVLPDTSYSIATQLKPGKEKTTFSAPNLQYFMDSPVKIGRLQWRTWTVTEGAKNLQIRLAAETPANEREVDTLAALVQKITEQAKAVFKSYPVYDFGTYTFLASINRYVRGDGMEHRNSTMIAIPGDLSFHPDLLDVFAHEYFHSWNVERIRPKTLEPFNFEKSNMSDELWFAEGFTQYYGVLLLVRAGIMSEAAYAGTLGNLVNSKLNTPGAQLYTPVQSSNMAVFTDAGVAIDKTNYQNIFTSYYYYGAAIALALDLALRTRFNRSLDEFMQEMWKKHGTTEIPYTIPDMQKALATISDANYAKNFFERYIYGHESPDYQRLLAAAGYQVNPVSPGKAWIGQVGFRDNTGLVITGNAVRNTPLYEAGLDIDDVMISIGDQTIKTPAALNDFLTAHKPGADLPLVYLHRGEEKKTMIRLAESRHQAVVPFERAEMTVSDVVMKFRKNWLGKK